MACTAAFSSFEKKKKINKSQKADFHFQQAAVLLPGHRRLLLLLLRLLLNPVVCCWVGGSGAGVRFTVFKCFM